MTGDLIIPAFIAGMLTFLAPCTLPLLPGYLAFISGVSLQDLQDPLKSPSSRRKIFLNGLLFVVGFSVVFVLLGSLFGLGGSALVSYRLWLSRVGGIFVILFGLFMIGVLRLPFFSIEKHFTGIKAIKPGHPMSSLLFGATFAFGWSPCVGPLLASILTLAAVAATVGQGAFLLSIFSLGLAVPFLITAASISSVSLYLAKYSKHFNVLSIIGGVFIIFLGILLLTNNMGIWIAYVYQWFDFINYASLLDYL